MTGYYLTTMTVLIPDDKLIVIRDGKKVEYEIDRVYVGNRSTRVKRKVIGKVDPVQPGRMFPNEAYFELFPDNEIPEEVRDEFLRECEIKRQMKVIRRNPEEIVDNVVRGIEQMRNYTSSGLRPPSPQGEGYFARRYEPPQGEGYAVLRRVFDEMYYAIEDLAGKFPNEVIAPFKVERINEVLGALRESVKLNQGGFPIAPLNPLRPNTPEPFGFLRLVEEGLTYSDVMLILKWYKVLPR